MSLRDFRMLGAVALGACLAAGAQASCLGTEDTAIPISTPTASFTVNGDGTLVDPRTGLMWMRCLLGQALVAGVCTGTASIYTWSDALAAAHAAAFAGHADWRLANPKEMASISEDRCAGPSLNGDLFPITSFGTWTSTPVKGGTSLFDQAWVIDAIGGMNAVPKNQEIPVLLVRKAP